MGFKLAAKVLTQYAENPEPSTTAHRLGMLKCKFPEYKELFNDTEKFIKKRR
jgi:hypothetical protein